MEFTAQMIADFLKGKIEGDPTISVNNISRIEDGKKGTLAFLANPKYSKYLYTTEASIVLINDNLVLEEAVTATLIRVADAYQSFASLLNLYASSLPGKKGIEPNSFIHTTATIGADCYIGAFAYIGENVKIGANTKIYPQVYIGDNSKIGENTTLYSGVKVYNDCIIGNDCIIHSSTVIGSDGFGFAPGKDSYQKIPQIGNVIIEDSVEIGSNVSVDRATIGSTIIRKGCKLDNLVQIAHNVELGENTVVVAQAGISGSSKIGKNCQIGGQVGIVGHIQIADNVKIGAKAGISNNVTTEGSILLGAPATDIREARKSMVLIRKLPELYERLAALERELKEKRETGE